ncbi:hypothetical protein [Xylella taiwanensis]|nr:hypothetical protein [Xylella taiwanensis]MCD8463616.1 hypothetical protein [Xylella taiwanensis]
MRTHPVLPKIFDTDLAEMFKKPVPPTGEEIIALSVQERWYREGCDAV